ncbi:MAG: putative 4-hydroxybenzoate polyprenyltransferase [Bacteroidales bacterium]|jgi:4-hydroxybenzoate polyprenyltransferase|nr:putative 4-hydroxybenzoate polyprenyltransferase [Bacteroidales bacterium]
MDRAIDSVKKYLSLVKFSHTVFAMPFAMIGFALGITTGSHTFSLRILLLVILCMISARNAAMGFNRWADRRFDTQNPRTASREIPTGKISPGAALTFVAINAALFIAFAYLINPLAFMLSPVALLITLGYSLTKRFTAFCHLILGLGLSLAPIGAYIAVTGRFAALPVIYSLIALTWTSGFDIIYALQDDEFDRHAGLRSIPAAAGRRGALIISSLIHTATFALVIQAGTAGNAGIMYLAGAVLFSALLLYQHLIVKPGDLSRVNIAFATSNGIASTVFAVFTIIDILVY